MTWVIGTVTLPFAPSSVRMPKSADKEQVKPDAGEPVNIVTGTKSTVTLKGTIANEALTAAQIVSTYITPLYGSSWYTGCNNHNRRHDRRQLASRFV